MEDRFSRIRDDPRFRRMPKNHRKFKVKNKFNAMFTDKKFQTDYVVDKEGRKIKTKASNGLKRYYEMEDQTEGKDAGKGDDEDDDEDEEQGQSSSEDMGEDLVLDYHHPTEERVQEDIPIGDASRRLAVVNLEWDRLKATDLLLVFRSFVPTESMVKSVTVYPSEFGKKRMEEESRRGPVMEDDDANDDDDDNFNDTNDNSDDDNGAEEAETGKVLSQRSLERVQQRQERRDKLQAKGDKIQSADETEVEEKRAGSVKGTTDQENEGGEGEGDSSDTSDLDLGDIMRELRGGVEELDEDEVMQQRRLRKYELTRMKYYYCVVECESVEAAVLLYKECDGMEFESSSNTLDLRFVPDDVTFDETPRDSASDVPANYRAADFFQTKAIQHTKVQSSWDQDDPKRSSLLRRKFTKEEMAENDLALYLASDNEDDDGYGTDGLVSAEDDDDQGGSTRVKLKKRVRNKYTALLAGLGGAGADGDEDDDRNNRGMEITFEPALRDLGDRVVQKQEEKVKAENETTWEARQRRRRERKAARKKLLRDNAKAEKRAKKGGKVVIGREEEPEEEDEDEQSEESVDESMMKDPFFADAFDDDEYVEPTKGKDTGKGKDKNKSKKKRKLDDEREDERAREELKRQGEMELLMMDDQGEEASAGFSLKDLVKQQKVADDEKAGKKKKRKKKKKQGQTETPQQDTFNVDVGSARFGPLFDNPDFAIDPTHPAYKKTAGMAAIQEERGTRRLQQRQHAEHQTRENKRKAKQERERAKTGVESGTGIAKAKRGNTNAGLASLVANVKRKVKANPAGGSTSTQVAPASASLIADKLSGLGQKHKKTKRKKLPATQTAQVKRRKEVSPIDDLKEGKKQGKRTKKKKTKKKAHGVPL